MPSSNAFRQAEEEYFRLRGQLAVRSITRERFDAALKQLMVQDAQGRWWMLGADTGKWFIHNGQAWMEATPPSDEVNRMPAPPRSEVDRMPAPPPRTPPPTIYPAPRHNQSLAYLLIGGGFGLALLVMCAVVLVILRGMPTSPSPVAQIPPASLPIAPPGTPPAVVVVATATPPPFEGNVTVLATSEPPKLLQPQEFATTSDALAQGIADLNRAELKFIRDAKTAARDTAPRLPGLTILLPFALDLVDDDLREIAARAISVAQPAEILAQSMAGQDGGSEAAGQTADQYASIARLGYALVIDAQNLRDGLSARSTTRADAINTIAEFGARLWNPSVTEPSITGNPFLPNVKDATTTAPVQFLNSTAVAQVKSRNPSSWLATSSDVVTKTVSVPAPRARVANLLDPNLPKTLSTASGQLDADTARQFAAMNLAALTANPLPSVSTPIQFAVFKSASIADTNQVTAGMVPSFANGTASALGKQATSGAETLISDLYTLNGQAPPRITTSTQVKEPKRVLTLTITRFNVEQVSKDSSGDWNVLVSLSLRWTASVEGLVNPQVDIFCGQGRNTVYGTAGQTQMKGMGYAWSWDEEHAYINCFSGINQKGSIGYVDGQARLLITLNRGTVTSVATLTLEPTDTATPTRTATPTATPDLSWIDGYVQGIADQLLAQRPNDGIAIAIVTDDLRQCLITAVKNGASQADAKSKCASALRSLATITPTRTATLTPTRTATKPLPLASNGRITFDSSQAKYQDSRYQNPWFEAAAKGDGHCVPEVTISNDGTLQGSCTVTYHVEGKYQSGGTYSYDVERKVRITGKVDPQSSNINFTYEVTETTPSDGSWWSITYTGSGNFTTASQATGTANFTCTCEPYYQSICAGVGRTFSGTVPWSFVPSK